MACLQTLAGRSPCALPACEPLPSGKAARGGAPRPARRRAPRRPAPAPPRAESVESSFADRVPPPDAPAVALSPSFWLSAEQAVEAQLKALQQNNRPYADHGVEVLYRFALMDPWQRSAYFNGAPLDLGQFERFKRIVYTPCFSTLVGHTQHEVLSTLDVSEDEWVARVRVVHGFRREERVYAFAMRRRVGGARDGVWYTQGISGDGCDARSTYAVI